MTTTVEDYETMRRHMLLKKKIDRMSADEWAAYTAEMKKIKEDRESA